jgi:hypothetical protein
VKAGDVEFRKRSSSTFEPENQRQLLQVVAPPKPGVQVAYYLPTESSQSEDTLGI